MTPSLKSMPLEDTGRFDTYETPGRQLRALREARKLDIDRVAAQLHLQRHVVEWLESDQYDRLPAPVFVIGYIKNYARLLGADPTPMIAAYRTLVPVSEPGLVQPAAEGGASSRADGLSRWGWAVAVLFLAFMVGGGALWLRGQGDQSRAFSPQTAGQAPAPAAPSTPPPSDVTQRAPAIPAPPESIPLRDLPRSTATNVTTGPALALPEPIAPAQAVAAVSPVPSVVARTDEESEAEALPETSTSPPSTAASSATKPPAAELEFEFSGTSWVDVRSANGKSVLSGKMRAGDRRVVQGEPPYKVVIGNASVTQLKVGGQPFDLKAHARGNVARFALDPNALD